MWPTANPRETTVKTTLVDRALACCDDQLSVRMFALNSTVDRFVLSQIAVKPRTCLKTQLNPTGNLMASSVQFSSVESLDMYWIYDDLRRPPTARDWPQASLNMFRIYRQS
jgi:hypothetical protein